MFKLFRRAAKWIKFDSNSIGQLELLSNGGMQFGPYCFGPTESLDNVYIDGCEFSREAGHGKVMSVTVPNGPTLLVKYDQGQWYHRRQA